MTIGNFLQFRALLTQLSGMNGLEQLGFVHRANASLDGTLRDAQMEKLNASAFRLFPWNGTPAAPMNERLRWIRWKDEQDGTGVALTFLTRKSAYAVFPGMVDPLSFTLLEPGASRFEASHRILKLLPTNETMARLLSKNNKLTSDKVRLAYVHKDYLFASPRPGDDVRRYERTLRLLQEGGVAPIPSFYPFLGDTLPYWIEDRHAGVHAAVFALQKGMDYVLGQAMENVAAYGAMTLSTAAKIYPAAEVLLQEAPDARDALPAKSCFGAGDPLHTPLDVEVRGQKLFRNAEGTVIGWARIVGGGEEGRYADPVSGLSAATSLGGRTYQQDGYYLAHFRSNDVPGGRDVRVFIGVDGLGGAERGEMASSAAVQGAHAGILRALREKRLPLAGDLFDAARDALEHQTLRDEIEDGSSYPRKKTPDTTISICVVVDGEATIATAGDFLTLLCALNAQGLPEVLGHTAVDATDDHAVHNTLRSGQKRLYRVRLPKGSWLVAGSDGAIEGLAPGFKRQTSRHYRQSEFNAYPEQSLFRNLLHVLQYAPPHAAGPALHDAASGSEAVPDSGGAIDANAAYYPGLGPIDPEHDNWTAAALYWEGTTLAPAEEPVAIPSDYQPLERVYPPFQYVHEDGPYSLQFPPAYRELFISGSPDARNRPTVVLADANVASPHIRLERVIVKNDAGDESERLFVEKLVGRGRVVLSDDNDKRITSFTRKGSRHEIKPGQSVRLTPRSFFRLKAY